MVNNKIDTTEVVDRLKNIIHIHCLVSDTDGVCLKDITRLIMLRQRGQVSVSL